MKEQDSEISRKIAALRRIYDGHILTDRDGKVVSFVYDHRKPKPVDKTGYAYAALSCLAAFVVAMILWKMISP